MSDTDMAYIGYEECGHVTLAIVDNPDHQKDTYRELAWATRHGMNIDRVTLAEARAKLLEWRLSDSVPCGHANAAEEAR